MFRTWNKTTNWLLGLHYQEFFLIVNYASGPENCKLDCSSSSQFWLSIDKILIFSFEPGFGIKQVSTVYGKLNLFNVDINRFPHVNKSTVFHYHEISGFNLSFDLLLAGFVQEKLFWNSFMFALPH